MPEEIQLKKDACQKNLISLFLILLNMTTQLFCILASTVTCNPHYLLNFRKLWNPGYDIYQWIIRANFGMMDL